MKILALICMASIVVTLVVCLNLKQPTEDYWNHPLVGLDGRVHKMKDFKGEYILLHFWNTWCPPCKNNLIRLDKAYEGLTKYMKVLPVVRGEKPEAIRNFLTENKISLPAFLDVDGRLSKSFNIKYVPSDRLINREGKVIVQNTGGLDWAQVLANIERDGGIREDKTTN